MICTELLEQQVAWVVSCDATPRSMYAEAT